MALSQTKAGLKPPFLSFKFSNRPSAMGVLSSGPSTTVPAQIGVSVLWDAVTSLSGALAVPSRPQRQEIIGEAVPEKCLK